MSESVLVTGGAGFVGSHLVDALLAAGHEVRILDNLEAQVHGDSGKPSYLNVDSELIVGDIRDRATVARALDGIDVVFHQAALVGVGQSMYDIERYCSVNTAGTGLLLDEIVKRRDRIRKVVVASSMSIYGEGAYQGPTGPVAPRMRSRIDLELGRWELLDPDTQEPLRPLSTAEDKPLQPTSVYAVTKRDHEELCLAVGSAYAIPTVALRYFNIYGSRQALSNPYTGVMAIFSSRLVNGRHPIVFEDGAQSRDFVHVSDIVQANLLAMESDGADYEAVNVGTGFPTTVLEVATAAAAALGRPDIEPEITGRFRQGDIRHCFADITKARKLLGYEPSVSFEEGIEEVVAWVLEQSCLDNFDQALEELTTRGLA